MIILALSAGDWENIGSAAATAFAGLTALWAATRKPQRIYFSFFTGTISDYEGDGYARWTLENIKHTLMEDTVKLTALKVDAINIDPITMLTFESGIIIKGDFRKIKLGSSSGTELYSNDKQRVDFGSNKSSGGYMVNLKNYKLNPFISNRKVSFRVYIKDTVGNIHKSQVRFTPTYGV